MSIYLSDFPNLDPRGRAVSRETYRRADRIRRQNRGYYVHTPWVGHTSIPDAWWLEGIASARAQGDLEQIRFLLSSAAAERRARTGNPLP